MTDRLTVRGRLTAAADRMLEGLLLPYGVPGYTSAGRVVAGPGSVTYPAEDQLLAELTATLDHLDERDPVAEFRSIRETPEGLMASWYVKPTHGGDKLLAEYDDGTRTGVSVELEPYAVKDGRLTAGQVVGCAFPVKPAFDTARLRLVAEDHTPDRLEADYATDSETTSTETYTDDDGTTYQVTTTRRLIESSTTSTTQPDDDTDDDGDQADDDNPPGEDPAPMTASATRTKAPVDLFTAARSGDSDALSEAIRTPADFYRLLASFHADPSGNRRLMAALADVTATAHTSTEQPAWVGELWSGQPYRRRVVPLVNTAPLTAMKVQGYRWVVKPEMAPYAGDKAPVPSNTPSTEPVNVDAERLAGAHDIDRKFRDFGDTGFFASYYQAMAESYARLSDAALAADLKAAATPVTPGTVPTDVSPAVAALVDGALAIVDEGTPSYALVAKDVWRELLLTRKDDVLAFLSMALGLEDGSMDSFRLAPAPAGALDAGEVLVGTRSAATFHELGGGAPIRVDAVDMAKGGEDHGCFGYYATVVHDSDAIALVDIDTVDETPA